MKNTYVAIMAGGIGSRFWPGSREHRPKQFLDILNVGKSLIRMTFERSLKICPVENIYVVTNKVYKEQVKRHLPELTYEQILCEPSRNNTAPCIAYTAFKLRAINPNANFVVASSDHIILEENRFTDYIKQAVAYTNEHNALVTLGLQPSRPDTGYGYINFEKQGENGVHKVIKFTEKPNLETAKQFVQSGDYLWNAGIFIWNVNHIIEAFKKHTPEIFNLFSEHNDQFNTPNEQSMIDEVYPKTPSISIDYAIMENAENIYTIPSSFGWSDLGTWNSLHLEGEKDENKNLISGNLVKALDTSDCLIRVPNDKLVIVKDMEDYIIVDEPDVLLIYPKSKEQEIKAITKQIREDIGDKFL